MGIETHKGGLEVERRVLVNEKLRARIIAEEESRARLRAEAKAAFENGYEEDVQGEEHAEWMLDPYAAQAREFRETWNADFYGPFDDTSEFFYPPPTVIRWSASFTSCSIQSIH